MALARTYAMALAGVAGHVVEIEADIENGLVALLVGLPDTALREARDRIRSAIVNKPAVLAAAAGNGRPVAGESAEAGLGVRRINRLVKTLLDIGPCQRRRSRAQDEVSATRRNVDPSESAQLPILPNSGL